jgi:parallel beta-helix repeat protein
VDKKSLRSRLLVVGIFLVFIGTGILPTVAQDIKNQSQITSAGNWLYVGGGGSGNYSKIQDAIDNASDNDTIYVYSGMYNENIVINKSISLLGQQRETTILLGANGSDIILLQDCSAVLTGFTIQKYDKTNDIGIGIVDCWSTYIYENYVTSCDIGIWATDFESSVISNNIFLNCTNGMFIDLIANITITQNRIEGNGKGYGIGFGGVGFGLLYKNYITRNSIMNNSLGLILIGAWSVVIQENNFIGNQQHAVFITSFLNKWNQNYWGQSSRFPKVILGSLGGFMVNKKIPLINFDWHPAQEPYDILRMS